MRTTYQLVLFFHPMIPSISPEIVPSSSKRHGFARRRKPRTLRSPGAAGASAGTLGAARGDAQQEQLGGAVAAAPCWQKRSQFPNNVGPPNVMFVGLEPHFTMANTTINPSEIVVINQLSYLAIPA